MRNPRGYSRSLMVVMLVAVIWFVQEAKLIHQQFSSIITQVNQVPSVYQLEYIRAYTAEVLAVQRVENAMVDSKVNIETEPISEQQPIRAANSISETERPQVEETDSTAHAPDKNTPVEGDISGSNVTPESEVFDPDEHLVYTDVPDLVPTTDNPALETHVAEPAKSQKVTDSSPDMTVYLNEVARAIHQQTNAARIDAGRSPLVYDKSLASLGKRHSADMNQRNFFAHTDPDGCDITCRLIQSRYEASAWGENIAWRSGAMQAGAAVLAAWFVTGWMESPGHRENILSGLFTHEGIGLYVENDVVYATAVFAEPR